VPDPTTFSLSRPQLRRPTAGQATLTAAAIALGVVIAAVDSRPTWDDSGITAAVLVLAAATVAAIDGRRPWLWAALIGLPLPLIEVPATSSTASAVALLFTAIGAAAGFVVHRAVRGAASH